MTSNISDKPFVEPALVLDDVNNDNYIKNNQQIDFRPFPKLLKFNKGIDLSIEKHKKINSMQRIINLQNKEMNKKENKIKELERNLINLKRDHDSNQKLYRKALSSVVKLDDFNYDPKLQEIFDGASKFSK